ncbi:MerR family transcriptional regulator [Paenibacillus sambharensis]|uniref:MerR family transcriptional regulator n=1 Tax=Paenibacillus sambharensis TaxID=1803190 RepID=A0A2W1LD45_9BACL|nr:MerR family transcriptional regulator [Paenibacillus sambharensis]PZD92972.1 MerR family transcriptional regulator [Paenibacillus sambharensis]
MYKIGVFSQMNKVTVKTLRHYDEIGLLKPAYVEQSTGYRYYCADQLQRLHTILGLKQIGFSLPEISYWLSSEGMGEEQMRRALADKKAQVTAFIAEEQGKLRLIEHQLQRLNKEVSSMAHVIVKALPEVIVASMRTTIKDSSAYFAIFPEMGASMEKQNVKCAVPAYCFTLYHDGEYKEQDIDVEICEAVTEFGTDTDTLTFKRIDAVDTAACLLHKGPYTTIGRSYADIMKWIADNGYEICGLPRESYIDGIWNKSDPEEWLTEIQLPVAARR